MDEPNISVHIQSTSYTTHSDHKAVWAGKPLQDSRIVHVHKMQTKTNPKPGMGVKPATMHAMDTPAYSVCVKSKLELIISEELMSLQSSLSCGFIRLGIALRLDVWDLSC